MISISLETLKTGKIRVTGRHTGSTVAIHIGDPANAKRLVQSCLRGTAPFHMRSDGSYDTAQVELNPAALEALHAKSPIQQAVQNAVSIYAESLGVTYQEAVALYFESQSTRESVQLLVLAQADPDKLKALAASL